MAKRKKYTKKWLEAMIKDEHMAHKNYAKHGFKLISEDEKRHEEIMRTILKHYKDIIKVKKVVM